MTATVLPEVDLKSLPGVRQFDLTGQVAIITGGSKGLGAAIAAGLASAGATTVIVSRGSQPVAMLCTSSSKASALANRWRPLSNRVRPLLVNRAR